jgi:glycosyltransferase involved in cell wall biosynthesis
MLEPLVSIKMITYNHAPYIAQAIEGVLMQKTNFPIELVIGEDCSTDGTREIVFDYQKKFPEIIRVITSDQNVGAKKNSYRTTKACRGKYIAFCEGDDYWHHPKKLQKQVDYMESHPECGLVYSSFDVYNNKSKEKVRDYLKNGGWEIPKNPSISDFVSLRERAWVGSATCTVMVRKNLLEQIIESDPYLHQNDQFLMGDTQLWAELSAISEVSYIPESLATYRILPESASRSKDLKKSLRFWKSACEMRLYLCDKYKLSEIIRNKVESFWCDCSLRLAFIERNGKLAFEVKKKKQKFTWKEWLRYLGAKYLVVNYICRMAAFSRDSFRNLLLAKRND